jgi:hypothetical protein
MTDVEGDLPPVKPFVFFTTYMVLRRLEMAPPDPEAHSTYWLKPDKSQENNAIIVTRTCLTLGLGEDDEVLQEYVVQRALCEMAWKPLPLNPTRYPYEAAALCVHPEHIVGNVKRILSDSFTVRERAMSHLAAKGNDAWQIALATWHEKDRDTLFDPIVASSDETSLNNLEQIFNTWMEEAWPFLNRLEKLLLDIYGNDRSAQTIAEKLQTDQVVYFWEPVVKSNSMLGQLMDICRMWNDTIASAKVQKLLFSKGLETC